MSGEAVAALAGALGGTTLGWILSVATTAVQGRRARRRAALMVHAELIRNYTILSAWTVSGVLTDRPIRTAWDALGHIALPSGRKSFDLRGTISVAYSGFRDLVWLVENEVPVDDENISRVLARTREAVIAAGVLGGRSRRQLERNFASVAEEEMRAAAAFSAHDASATHSDDRQS